MNAETSDTPVQITYPTNVGQSTFHKLHLHQFQQTKRSQEIHFWRLKITRRFDTLVKQLSLSQSTFAAKWHTQTWTEEVKLTLCPTGSALLLRLTDGDRRIFLWALSMTTWGSSFPSLEHLHTPIPNRITLWISNWLLLRAMCSFRVKNLPSVNVIHLLIGQSNYSASHITCSKNSMQRSTLTVISHTNSRLWRFITVIDFIMIRYNAIY